MNQSLNSLMGDSFVVFEKCSIHKFELSDLMCVVCDKFFCERHIRCCVSCHEAVCAICYKKDQCCQVKRGKTREQLLKFYRNKRFHGMSFYQAADMEHDLLMLNEPRPRWCDIRENVARASYAYYAQNFDLSFLGDGELCGGDSVFANCFPPLKRLLEQEKERLVCFVRGLCEESEYFFARVAAVSDVSEELVEMVEDQLRGNVYALNALVMYAVLLPEAQPLFRALERRGLLDFNQSRASINCAGHVDALRWIESQGIDVLRDPQMFRKYTSSQALPLEYLLQKGLSLDTIVDSLHAKISSDTLEVLLRVRGLKCATNLRVEDQIRLPHCETSSALFIPVRT